MSEFFRKLKWLFERRRKEDELREELQFHLDEEADERRAEGLPEQDARMAARRELGNISLLREDARTAWGWTMIEQFAQDLRYATRTMSANKLFSVLAIVSLALGMGANTAIYSFMDSILLRSLPVSNPESLAMLNWHAKEEVHGWSSFVMHSINGYTYDDPSEGTTAGIFPFPAFELFQKNDSAFSAVFAYGRAPNLNVAVKGQAYLTSAEYVSGDYFRGLGVLPDAGRLIIPDDDRVGAPSVAVVSFAFSQRCFGGPANAAGQKVLINNLPFIVAGVTPPGFFGVDPAAAPDVFLPLHANLVVEAGSQYGAKMEGYLDKNYYWIEVMGRLRPGVSLAQAQATMAPAFANWVASTAGTDLERANLPSLVVKPGGTGLESLRRKYSRPLYVLMTLVGLILAIACANVANLLLARAAARRREIALRLSVGAGRFRVVRQLLTESVLLSSLGGVLGILFAIWGMRFLTLVLANGDAKFTLHAELNWHVLSVAATLSLLTGLLFGLAPAMQSTRVDVISAMKEMQAGQPMGRRSFWRISLSHALIVGQIAVSLLMLIAAGLFVRTLSNLQSIELGFNRDNILLFNLNARQAGRHSAEIAGFYANLLEQFKNIPGVREASLSNHSLINAGFALRHSIPGKKRNPGDRMLVVGPSFFKTMQIPIMAGREIDEHDLPGSLPIAVVSEQFAKVNFGDENPIGQHVILSAREHAETRDMEIVGIARNARYGGLKGKVPPVLYIPYNQGFPQPEDMIFELRTAGDPLAYVNTVRKIVRQADSRIPLSGVKTQVAEIDQTINQEIVFARLCSAFAILALVIACVGLYGTVSYNVARRTGEIGIRMALGAQRSRVVRMILVQVLVLAAVGLAIGVPAALGASKLIASFLFGMKPNDPLALTAAVAILLGAAILAGYAPARRASRIDPMAALRHE
jgi:macrolide transport system ATP-binding/permease protein